MRTSYLRISSILLLVEGIVLPLFWKGRGADGGVRVHRGVVQPAASSALGYLSPNNFERCHGLDLGPMAGSGTIRAERAFENAL